MEITRRQLIGGVVAGAAGSTLISAAEAAEKCCGGAKAAQLKNEDFYKDGKFDAAAAKQAYFAMLKRFGYPILPVFETDACYSVDFGTDKFTTIGLGGIMWMNNIVGKYMGHEIFLLPGQMIAEHKHVKTEKASPKMEGWQVRYGSIYVFGEGEPTPGWEKIIPADHQGDYLICKNYKKVMPGETAELAGAEQWHFMVAGPEGAIATEYASYHDGAALRFTHPKGKL